MNVQNNSTNTILQPKWEQVLPPINKSIVQIWAKLNNYIAAHIAIPVAEQVSIAGLYCAHLSSVPQSRWSKKIKYDGHVTNTPCQS